jgi:hypothetical protein
LIHKGSWDVASAALCSYIFVDLLDLGRAEPIS